MADDQATTKSAKKHKLEDLLQGKLYIYAVGRRKEAIAKVRLYTEGKGRIHINSFEFRKYFPYFEFQKIITKPLDLIKEKQNLDLSIFVQGGGVRGQADAICLGVARAIVKWSPEYREKLR